MALLAVLCEEAGPPNGVLGNPRTCRCFLNRSTSSMIMPRLRFLRIALGNSRSRDSSKERRLNSFSRSLRIAKERAACSARETALAGSYASKRLIRARDESSSFPVYQQFVIAIRQSIRYVRFHNPITRNERPVSDERGLGCSNLAFHSLAVADDCSAKGDCLLHNAASCEWATRARGGFFSTLWDEK